MSRSWSTWIHRARRASGVTYAKLTRRGDVHAVCDGAKRRGWMIRGGHDAALLPVDGRDYHDIRHTGGHGRGRSACDFGDQQRVGESNRAVDCRDVLLRGLRGRGDGRVGHDQRRSEREGRERGRGQVDGIGWAEVEAAASIAANGGGSLQGVVAAEQGAPCSAATTASSTFSFIYAPGRRLERRPETAKTGAAVR